MYKTLLSHGISRAGFFFLLALGISLLGGLLLGDIRLGVEIGILMGIIFAILAYVFIRPVKPEREI